MFQSVIFWRDYLNIFLFSFFCSIFQDQWFLFSKQCLKICFVVIIIAYLLNRSRKETLSFRLSYYKHVSVCVFLKGKTGTKTIVITEFVCVWVGLIKVNIISMG